MIVKTILVKKHSFGSFEVDSIGPVSETANDIRLDRIAVVLSEWTILDICECAPSLMEFFIQANLIQEAWWEPRMLMEPKIRMSTWIYLETALFILTQLARYKLMHYWGNI